MRLKPVLVALGCLVVVAGVLTGLVSGLFGAAARSGLYATGLWSTNGPSTLPPGTLGEATPTPTPSPTASATSAAPTVALPPPVLAAASTGRPPSAAEVAARIGRVSTKDARGSWSGSVVDVGSGRVLYAHDARQARIPASTMKLLTTTAALSLLGPEHRFATSVVSPGKGRLVLVGGGDPYLLAKRDPAYPGRATLSDLARTTAAQLEHDRVTRVGLTYDASRFRGPAWNPTWPDTYSDVVSPVSALWVNEGRVGSGIIGPRVKNAARDAAQDFAKALGKQGVTVTSVKPGHAGAAAAEVASVSSMPLERIVQQLLMTSDNDAAEVVLRQAAIGAGRPGSFADGVRAVRARLTQLGIWDSSTVIHDGSGLSRQTRVPADTMVKLLRLAAEERHPELRGVITGLPVAGVEGSLRVRFFDDQTLAARGLVRGKTGTLTGVHSLAGFVRSRDGSLLVYAFLVNKPKNDYAAVIWLDRVAAALAGCGCH